MKKQVIKIELTKEEADYLSGLVEGQLSKLIFLDEKKREKKPVKKDIKIFSSIGEKFITTSPC